MSFNRPALTRSTIAVMQNADFVIMHQDAFAPMLGSNEIFLLGKVIKYAGFNGKEVRIASTHDDQHRATLGRETVSLLNDV
jgi:hypothetical protein